MDRVLIRLALVLAGACGAAVALAQAPPVTTAPGTGRALPTFDLQVKTIASSADMVVTYRRHDQFGMWLPVSMTEWYVGPIPRQQGTAITGQVTTNATYSDFKQFQTGARIIPQ